MATVTIYALIMLEFFHDKSYSATVYAWLVASFACGYFFAATGVFDEEDEERRDRAVKFVFTNHFIFLFFAVFEQVFQEIYDRV